MTTEKEGKYLTYSEIIETIKDPVGRYILAYIKIMEEYFVLLSIYSPTQNHENEQIQLINDLKHVLQKYNGECIISGGDFNVCLDPINDKKGGSNNISCQKYRPELKAFLETFNLTDIWRETHENDFQFTWHCKKKKIFSRLDYWFITDHLSNRVNCADILPSILSDHSIIKLSLRNIQNNIRGPGVWKFNTLLLKDPEYINVVKHVIRNSEQMHDNENKGLLSEMIKMDIRTASISYSKNKKYNKHKVERELQHELLELTKKISEDPQNSDYLEHMISIENNLKAIYNEKINGQILRAKSKWAEEGERNTSYFLKLEKRNYNNKHITQLLVDDKIVTNDKEILNIERTFYQDLYSEKPYQGHCASEISKLLA